MKGHALVRTRLPMNPFFAFVLDIVLPVDKVLWPRLLVNMGLCGDARFHGTVPDACPV
jgi:hypothetical protein